MFAMGPKRTWVLIADAGRARILLNEGPGRGLKEVKGMTFERELPRAHDLVADRQPRAIESVGHARHAIDGKADPRRKEKRKLIEELAEVLDHALAQDKYDNLVIVAPAQALGDMRQAITEPVRKVVLHEVNLDLTKTPDTELGSHLAHVLKI
jgi:protein required for attachment to host cells